MNLFERIPTELFSVLASPNRALYADALDVLWEAYRDNLKIPEHVLYSMLRSKLEQQLADATFEGEDIDEEELRDISGRARFLIRKLYSKGWFEKERSEDFDEYITVPGYSSSLLKLFHQLRDDSPIRGYSYVFSTYSTLKVADESGSIYDKMAAVYNAYDNTQALLQLLQMVYHNVKHFFQLQMKMQEVNDVLASHFDDFGQKVVEAYIRPLKIKDSVPKYRVPIQTILTNWAEDDALLAALANAALQDRRGTALAECRRDLLQKIFEVKDCYDSIESEYPRPKKVSANVLTPTEVEDYLDAAQRLDYLPMFLLALTAGLRQGELIALKWSDLDVNERTLTISESRSVERRELVEYKGGNRTVSLTEEIVELLRTEHARHPSSPLMFMHPATQRPYSPQMVRRMHNEIIKEAGLDHIRFADLRHTCAVLALQNGMDAREVSQMLGHFRTSMTRQNYAPYLTCPAVKSENNPNEASQEELRQAADILGNLLKF